MKMIGRIVFYIPQRKFGFIHTSDGQEFLFHISNFMKGAPALSLNVEFERAPAIREGRGDQAVCISPVDLKAQASDVLSGGARGGADSAPQAVNVTPIQAIQPAPSPADEGGAQ